MHIVNLTAENFKRLRAVRITPRGHVVPITGKNGSGKTSVLDAIAVALGGLSLADPEPVRHGAKRASITITLSDGAQELRVSRVFTEGGSSSLQVEDATGKLGSPQKVLDALLGHLAFDPLAFTRLAPKAQLEQLRTLVPLDVDLDELDRLNAEDREERATATREAKELRARLAAEAEPPDGTPDEEQDASELRDQLREASRHNGAIDAAREERDRHTAEIAKVEQRIENGKRLLEELEAQLAALKARSFGALGDVIDTEAIAGRLAELSTINEHVRLKRRLATLDTEAADRERRARELTERMKARDEQKAAAIARAPMPVPGLGFGDGAVTFKGVPLQQASTAEQIRVSLAIGMAANPRLRVMHIRDGSLLDSDSLALVGELALQADYQVWMERVDASGRVGVVIEDGQVVGDFQDGPDLTFNLKAKAAKAAQPPVPADVDDGDHIPF